MIYYGILGILYACTAVVQPGPLQSYLISQSLTKGWRKTLPAAFAPLISDGPILILVLFVLSTIPVWSLQILQVAGGIFLLYLAFQTWKTYQNFIMESLEKNPSSQTTLLQAVGVNILNPAPYLGWSCVLGPILIKGWNEHPINGIALVIGFYATIIVGQMCLIVLFSHAKRLGAKIERFLIGISAVFLALFGCYQLWTGISSFKTLVK